MKEVHTTSYELGSPKCLSPDLIKPLDQITHFQKIHTGKRAVNKLKTVGNYEREHGFFNKTFKGKY
jgi:hypothetical protein